MSPLSLLVFDTTLRGEELHKAVPFPLLRLLLGAYLLDLLLELFLGVLSFFSQFGESLPHYVSSMLLHVELLPAFLFLCGAFS